MFPRNTLRSRAGWLRAAALVALGVAPIAAPARAQEEMSCLTAVSPEPVPIAMTAAELDAARVSAQVTQPFDIVIEPGPALAANPAALAAFERAARQWEQKISDPITVTVVADLVQLGPGPLGRASSVTMTVDYATLRDAIRRDASGEAADAIAGSVPQVFVADVPPSSPFNGRAVATKANMKALGFTGLDEMLGRRDVTIEFNLMFPFDFDNRDGVSADRFDFESIAAHEIGHALGFISGVDLRNATVVSPAALDLFRFADGAQTPTNAGQFASFRRNLVPNTETNFSDTEHVLLRLSTGAFNGDGRQASHWKDDELLGFRVGVMDPTIAPADVSSVVASDLRMLDLIGYEIASADADPVVTISPNGDPAGAGLTVASGAFVLFQSDVSDADGLGFPIFLFLGSGGRVIRSWDFGGGIARSGDLSIFSPSPLVEFRLAPGESSRRFDVRLFGVDFLGDITEASVPVTVVRPTPPNVVVRANGVSGPVRIRNGGTVQFAATASDPDGLGYPLFNGFGNTGDVTFVWSFAGGTPVSGGVLSIFTPNPNVRFDLAAGENSRRFNVSVTVVDALGAQREVPIAVDVVR